MPHWLWGLLTALMVSIVIYLNGRGVRAGWLVGVAVQLVYVAYGLAGPGEWTFVFALIPAGMFAWNYWVTPRRAARARAAVVRELLAPEREVLFAPGSGELFVRDGESVARDRVALQTQVRHDVELRDDSVRWVFRHES